MLLLIIQDWVLGLKETKNLSLNIKLGPNSSPSIAIPCLIALSSLTLSSLQLGKSLRGPLNHRTHLHTLVAPNALPATSSLQSVSFQSPPLVSLFPETLLLSPTSCPLAAQVPSHAFGDVYPGRHLIVYPVTSGTWPMEEIRLNPLGSNPGLATY